MADNTYYKGKHSGNVIDTTIDYVKKELPEILTGKVNVEENKGLSTNDFTNTLKQKLDSLPTAEQIQENINNSIAGFKNLDYFIVNMTYVSDTKASLDKIYSEIKGAIENNKIVLIKFKTHDYAISTEDSEYGYLTLKSIADHCLAFGGVQGKYGLYALVFESGGCIVSKMEFAQSDLSNISNEIFKKKANEAGINGNSSGAVSSVNKKTGDVVLTAEDIGTYAKDEINSKLSSVYKYKGTVNGYPFLPTNAEIGDVYNIRFASGENNTYIEEPILYSNYEIDEGNIPSFSENGLSGFFISIELDSKPSFMNGETLDVGVYAPSYFSTMTNFIVPILDSYPYQATSCAYYEEDVGYLYIFVVDSEAPFNGASQNGYDTKYDEIYDYIKNHPWNADEKPSLQFNNEMKYTYEEPYLVNAGDNVAWTGTEWDVLAGTIDVSKYAEKSTTLEGYGITDAYTKTETESLAQENLDNINATLNMYYYDKSDSDSRFATKEDLSKVTGKVESVNGQTGDVNLTLEDISDNITADEGKFTYSGSGVKFQMDLSGFSFSTTSYNGLSLDHNGLVYSGSPFTDDDIILNQISWVDENDQSQGTVTTTHKLSEKADKSTTLSGYGIEDAYTKAETNAQIGSAISSGVTPTLEKKVDEPNVLKWDTAGKPDFVLEDNQEAYFSNDAMALLTITMPSEISDYYHSNFCFKSGETPTELTYSATPIIWVGDDCDADGAFVPEPNTRYEVCVKKLGDDIVARVGAY